MTCAFSVKSQVLCVIAAICLLVEGQEYRCIDGEVLTITDAPSTIVTRLGGEDDYGDDLKCSWYIEAPIGKRIQVNVVASDLQYAPTGGNCHAHDFVGVQEEKPLENFYHQYTLDETDSFQWCGNETPHTFSSRDHDLFIEFQTNERNFYPERGVTMEIQFFSNHTCPPGWVEDDTLDDSQNCYKLRMHKASWQDAQEYCTREQANLVSFQDEREADFITGMLEARDDLEYKESVWIGLNDIHEEGDYVWIDHIHSSANHRWAKDPHKSSDYDNCVAVITYSGTWEEQFCSDASIQSLKENKFICKTKKHGMTALYEVPADSPERKGEGSDVPIIAIILFIVVAVILVFILFLVFVLRHKKAQRRKYEAGKRPEISYTDIPMQQEPNRRTSPSGPQPPSYSEAIR